MKCRRCDRPVAPEHIDVDGWRCWWCGYTESWREAMSRATEVFSTTPCEWDDPLMKLADLGTLLSIDCECERCGTLHRDARRE